MLSSILSYPLWCACISHSFSLSIDDRLLCGLVSEFLRERSPAMIVRQLPLAARLTLRVGTRAGPTLSTSNDGRVKRLTIRATRVGYSRNVLFPEFLRLEKRPSAIPSSRRVSSIKRNDVTNSQLGDPTLRELLLVQD